MKRIVQKVKDGNVNLSTFTNQKWVLNLVMIIGGLLIGLGIGDCLNAISPLDLDQAARGLTIFSAGLTITVLVDNTKTQKAAEQIQQETQLQLKNIAQQLDVIYHSQQRTEAQLEEMKEAFRERV